MLSVARSQSPGTGSIEGRVLNATNGGYLEKARVTVEGTGLEAFTDVTGFYRLTGVPAGTARVTVFYTGLVVPTAAVVVSPGAVVTRDFSLDSILKAADAARSSAPGVVRLDTFVVKTDREMDGAAIAINEQRFASNMTNVVSAEEFGHVAEGNVGEFLKFLPGITIEYGGGDARTISMGGVSAENVPVSIGGFALASAQSSGTGRTVELEQVSINNIARIEVYTSPTPESPGSALAGGVNMVPRSAFERARPMFSGSLNLMGRDGEKQLHKTPGPMRDKTYKVTPGYDFAWVVPVNKRFGFTLSSGYSSLYTPQLNLTNTWIGAGNASTGPAASLPANPLTTYRPDTTPDQPYLANFALRDTTKFTTRISFGTTLDYRLAPNDRLAFSLQWAVFDAYYNNRTMGFNINRVNPGNFTPTYTHGAPGTGTVSVNGQQRQKAGTTWMPSLVWRHDGPLWKIEAGVAHSHASNHYRDIDKGFLDTANTARNNLTIAFDDIFYLRPGRITVADGTTGQPVDPFKIDSRYLTSTSIDTWETSDLQRSVYANLRRDFQVNRIPISIKGGLDLRNSTRDIRGDNRSYTYVGADRIAYSASQANSDDGAAFVHDEVLSQRGGLYGFPSIQYPSHFKLWEFFKANPTQFTGNDNDAYRAAVGRSKFADEIVSSAYLRTDFAFFTRRLKTVAGLRAEQTNIKAEGALTDPTRNYRRDAQGNVIPQRDANGNIIFTGTGANRIPAPTLIEPATINGVSNALAQSRLTYLDRGQHTNKEYLRWFPSLNVSYNLLENLIVRGATFQSIGRPNFIQYTGGLTLPDTELPPNASSANQRISVNNAGIKPWTANTAKVRVEYYFPGVGEFNIGVYRRDYANFFGSITLPVASPEFLALYNLDPDLYGEYPVATNYNLRTRVRMEGTEFSYKQALTFLPRWGRGVQVFANLTANRATGDGAANFAGFIPRTYNWGVSLNRERYNLRANWNYRGRQRRGLIAASARSIEANTYDWGSRRLYIDLSGEYRFTRRLSVFMSMRNVNDTAEDFERYGPNTPPHAQFRSREAFGSLWTLGLKGTF